MNELAENELFHVRERMKRIKREEKSNDYALDHRRSLARLHSSFWVRSFTNNCNGVTIDIESFFKMNV